METEKTSQEENAYVQIYNGRIVGLLDRFPDSDKIIPGFKYRKVDNKTAEEIKKGLIKELEKAFDISSSETGPW
jgi:hypothetical protein